MAGRIVLYAKTTDYDISTYSLLQLPASARTSTIL